MTICCACPGDGGGGDGSSGSEGSGNDGGVSTVPFQSMNIPTTYDVLRGLGIVGSSAADENEDNILNNLPGCGRSDTSRHTEVRMRLTPGTMTSVVSDISKTVFVVWTLREKCDICNGNMHIIAFMHL